MSPFIVVSRRGSLAGKRRGNEDRIIRMCLVDGVLDDLPIFREDSEAERGRPRPPDFTQRVVWKFEAEDGHVRPDQPWRPSCRFPGADYTQHLSDEEARVYLETGYVAPRSREEW